MIMAWPRTTSCQDIKDFAAEPAAEPAAPEAEKLKAAETALNNAKGLLDTPVARRKFGDDWLYTGTVESIRAALALFASRAPAA